MLGGGIFITQNKVLPGSYINFVNASKASGTVGERGVVAIPLALNKAKGTILEITKEEFMKDAEEVTGHAYDADEVIALREIFCHATKVYVYDKGTVSDTYDPMGVLNLLEPYEFNVFCAYESGGGLAYVELIKSWRDELGKKCQLVVYNGGNLNHEGIINVVATHETEGAPVYALSAWVAGAMAGCAINESCTNMLYDGELDIVTTKTQSELEECIENGQIAFHLVYGDVRLLEDVNSLTSVTADKGEDFKSNQTIRVIDQIANDIAKLYNTKYLGKIQNNASGRVSLWADVVAHHRQLEELGAIEHFNADSLTVEQGANKKSVVVNDVITVTNCMAQLYMTVVVQ